MHVIGAAQGWLGSAAELGEIDFKAWPWVADAPVAVAEGRVYADQEWRPEGERYGLGSYRGWVAAHTDRSDKAAAAAANERTADVVAGMWTCCHNLAPQATGCEKGPHNNSWARCKQCARWLPLARWNDSTCRHHPQEPVCPRGGAAPVVWPCCGEAGTTGNRAGDAPVNEFRKWKNVPLEKGGDSESGQRGWLVAQSRRSLKMEKIGPLAGCVDADHVPEGPEGPEGEAADPSVLHGGERCTQCWCELPGGVVDPADKSCRFHPGTFVLVRVSRYALGRVWTRARLTRKVTLPTSRSSLYYRYADKQRLTQRCTNAGCDYVTDIRDDFRRHMKDECAFAMVDCPDCGEKNLRRCDLPEHKANVCPMGTASCPLCAAVVKRSELEAHQRTDCPNRLVPCPRECGEWMR